MKESYADILNARFPAFSRLMTKNMKRNLYAVIVCIMAFVMTSCDPSSSVSYVVVNHSEAYATIDIKENVGYRISCHDSASAWKTSTTCGSIVLAPNASLESIHEWVHSSPQPHTPLWDDINSIQVGDSLLPDTSWNSEAAWEKTFSQDGSFDLEHITYSLHLW